MIVVISICSSRTVFSKINLTTCDLRLIHSSRKRGVLIDGNQSKENTCDRVQTGGKGYVLYFFVSVEFLALPSAKMSRRTLGIQLKTDILFSS